MAILLIVHAADNVVPHGWITGRSLHRVEHFHRYAMFAGQLGAMCFFVESMLRFTEHQEPVALQTEFVAELLGELLIAGPARQVQVSQQRRTAAHVACSRGSPEAIAPAQEFPG